MPSALSFFKYREHEIWPIDPAAVSIARRAQRPDKRHPVRGDEEGIVMDGTQTFVAL